MTKTNFDAIKELDVIPFVNFIFSFQSCASCVIDEFCDNHDEYNDCLEIIAAWLSSKEDKKIFNLYKFRNKNK